MTGSQVGPGFEAFVSSGAGELGKKFDSDRQECSSEGANVQAAGEEANGPSLVGSARELESSTDELAAWIEELTLFDSQTDAVDQGQTLNPLLDALLVSVARPAMACEFEVLLNQHQYPQGTEVALAALDIIEQMETILSVYQARSDFSALNRWASEKPVSVQYDALRVLEIAQAVYRWTTGAFDITAGALSEAWGFSRRQGRKPDEAQIEKTLTQVGMDKVSLLPESQVHFSVPGLAVNPGGIGKGYALDRAAKQMREQGICHFMMHGGLSSVVAFGDRQNVLGGGGWQVSLKHPWRWEEHLGTIRLRDGALGTSGSGKQFFHVGGQRYSHIIDPRTGWPAQGMMSATVLCPSATLADALATGFFVMGVEKARDFCEEHPQIGAILVHQDKSGRPRIDTINISNETWQPA